MAFAGQDNFESYTSGGDLNSGSGGSGWSANWSATTTNVKVQTGTVYTGGKAGDIDATSGEAEAVRQFTATGDGSMYVAIQKDVVANTGLSVSIQSGAGTHIGYVSLHTDGNIKMYYDTGWDTNNIMTYSAGQWYLLNIEWDDTAESDSYRVRVHDGTNWTEWTDWLATLATYTTIDRMRIANNASPSTGTSYFDNISDTNPLEDPTGIVGSGLETGLVSHWKMEEASGTRYDSHGDNDLSDGNTVAQGTGKFGNSADYTASNSEYLTITDSSQSGLDLTDDFTFGMWMKVASQPATDTSMFLINKWDNGVSWNVASYAFKYVDVSGTKKLQLGTSNGTTGGNVDVDWTATLDNWHYVAVRYDESAGSADFFVDGSQVSTTQTGLQTSLHSSSADVYIGSGELSGSPAYFFDGELDEVSIWNRLVVDSEFTQLYNAGDGLDYVGGTDIEHTGLTSNLISHWELEESSGEPRVDSYGANHLVDDTTVAQGTGKQGNCADFDGSEELFITDGNQTGLDFDGDMSISTWINHDTVASNQGYVSKFNETGNNRSYSLRYKQSSTELQFLTYSDGTNVGANHTETWSPSASTWYHIVVTKTGTTTKLFVNGSQLGSDDTATSATVYGASTADFVLGVLRKGGGDENLDGQQDETSVFDKALTYGEIQALYNDGDGREFSTSTVETLRPTGAGDETNVSNVIGESNNWEAVDDTTPDDATTRVFHNTDNTSARDLYAITDSTGSGTIERVRVFIRGEGISAWFKSAIKEGSTTTESAQFASTADDTYNTKSTDYTYNPDTGEAWTWDEIDALQAGVVSYRDPAQAGGITQVYVEVYYASEGGGEPSPSTTNALALCTF